jgi:hypothetical protein
LEPLSLSLSPLARGEGIQTDTSLPKPCQKLICALCHKPLSVRDRILPVIVGGRIKRAN